MSLNVYFKDDIRSAILAGLVLAIKTAHASEYNIEYLDGILSMAHHQALGFGISWQSLLADARQELITSNIHLLFDVNMPVIGEST